MQTQLTKRFQESTEGKEADAILRSCVHCGFCNATCPTYQLLGDELDGPRGRIYLIKSLLEGVPVTHKTQTHLDRCLSCRACETTCPSGVRYGRLLDIGRNYVEQQVARTIFENTRRYLLRKVIPNTILFSALLTLGKIFKPVLPESLKSKIPVVQKRERWPATDHARKMLILEGCAQSVVSAGTNLATARVLDQLSISLVVVQRAGCCGAVSHHLSAHEEALTFARRNIDAWWPHIAAEKIEAIVVTASGCGVMLKDYAVLLKHDTNYAAKAQRVSELAKDISEIIANEKPLSIPHKKPNRKVAYHSPCTLQHGQKLNGLVESLLEKSGIELTPVNDAHLCCGSAGTYSILQEELSLQLRDNKLAALLHNKPDVIATANIGCQMHLAAKAGVPVVHWIELLDDRE